MVSALLFSSSILTGSDKTLRITGCTYTLPDLKLFPILAQVSKIRPISILVRKPTSSSWSALRGRSKSIHLVETSTGRSGEFTKSFPSLTFLSCYFYSFPFNLFFLQNLLYPSLSSQSASSLASLPTPFSGITYLPFLQRVLTISIV